MGWSLTVFVTAVCVLVGAALFYWLDLKGPDATTDALAIAKALDQDTQDLCDHLSASLPERVLQRQHPLFPSSLRSYWSIQQRTIIPACIVRPTDVSELSEVVSILGKRFRRPGNKNTTFAIRSGGHAPSAGISSSQGGINIDLSLLNQVELSADRQHATIGAGARWIDVYEKLEPFELVVAGGRISEVGVGGLVLGGGISFFSPRKGFICDNVINYELLLADSRVINVNEDSHADLFVALKGGGNNLGIVTKFTARVFPQGQLWSGYNYHPASAAPELLGAFNEFCDPTQHDPYATVILALIFNSRLGATGVATIFNYTKAEKGPKIFTRFMKARRFWSTMRLCSLSDATRETNSYSPPGFCQLFQTTTFETNLEVLNECHKIFKESVQPLRRVKGLTWSLVFQPLPPSATSGHGKNSFGIETTKTLVIALVSTSWKRLEDQDVVSHEAESVIGKIEAKALETGSYHPFKYLNYARPSQDPLAGYGADNKRMLQEMSRKYDPDGLFQRGFPGGFKLF